MLKNIDQWGLARFHYVWLKAIRTGDLATARQLIQFSKSVPTHYVLHFSKFMQGPHDPAKLPVLEAAAKGQRAMVKLLLDEGLSLQQSDNQGRTALYRALGNGHFEIAQDLIERGAATNSKTTNGAPLWMAALMGGSREWTEKLLNGDDLKVKTTGGLTALHSAALSGDPEVFDWILHTTRYPIDIATKQGRQPYDFSGSLKLAQHIRKLNPKSALNRTHTDGGCSLFDMVRIGGYDAALDLLDQEPELKKVVDKNKNTVMHYGVESGDIDFVRGLIERKVSVESRNKANWRPLHWAAYEGNLEMARLLIEEGDAKADIKGNSTFIIRETPTPLYTAIDNGASELALYLIDHTQELDALCDANHETAMTQAVRSNDLAVLKKLLEKGASPNGISKDPERPDYFTFPLGCVYSADAVELLLQHGADLNAHSLRGSGNALRCAIERIDDMPLDVPQGQRVLQAIHALLKRGISLDDGRYDPMEQSTSRKEILALIRAARTNSDQAEGQPETPRRAKNGALLLPAMKHASTKEKLEYVESLIADMKGEEFDYRDTDYSSGTALHEIIARMTATDDGEKKEEDRPSFEDYVRVTKQMITQGADINAFERTWNGNALGSLVRRLEYPASEVMKENLKSFIQWMYEKGADADLKNDDGVSAREMLAKLGYANWLQD